jgi:hypothetical protein
MSDDPSDASIPPTGAGQFPSPGGTKIPGNWKDAFACLISSKIAIFQIEAKEAAGTALAKILPLILGIFFLVGAWILLIAGLIGLLSINFDWIWYNASFAIAGAHLLFGALMLLIMRSKGKEPFPVTRAEFEKDLKWLDQLKNPSNSEN